MEKQEYRTMYQVEDRHWWYVGLHDLVVGCLFQYRSASGTPYILDAGNGTGKLMDRLRSLGGIQVGMDLAAEAIEFSQRRNLSLLVRGSILDIPLRSELFNVVVSLDVVDCLDADEATRAFGEFYRVLRPGGSLLLNLPAYQFLRSTHDQAIQIRHRFRKSELHSMLMDLGFRVSLCTYRNTIVFPLAATARIVKRLLARWQQEIRSDLNMPPTPINFVLSQLLFLENYLILKRIALPVGLSVFCVAKKPL